MLIPAYQPSVVGQSLNAYALRWLLIEWDDPNYRVTKFGSCLQSPATAGIRTVISPRFYHLQSRKQRLGVLERRAHLVPVCAGYLLVPLRIVPDDQRLTTLDVFLVVSHRQSVSDLLILGFFGIWRDVDVHGNVLGGIMRQTSGSSTKINEYYVYQNITRRSKTCGIACQNISERYDIFGMSKSTLLESLNAF